MRIVYLKKRLSDNILILAILVIYCLLALVLTNIWLNYSYNKDNNIEPIVSQDTIEIVQHIEEPQPIIEEKSIEELWFEKLSEKYKVAISDIVHICGKARFYAKKYNIDYYEVTSLIGAESEFYQYAVSYLGHKYGNGLMQVSQIVLTEYNWKHNTNYTINDLYDMDINLEIGCWYYARLRDHYNIKNEPIYMLSAYNMGPYSKELNNNYVGKVLANLSML